MIRLYQPTIWIRATVDQQARIILPAEDPPSASEPQPKNRYRRVTLITPAAPEVFIGIDVPIQQGFDQPGIGPNRTWTTPAVSGGQVIPFTLQSHQFLTAMAGMGTAFLSVICEYVEDF